MAEDAVGLAFSLDVPDTSLGRDILYMVERRDIGGMSFAFKAIEEVWPIADRRELRTVDLLEISVVQAFPAYSQTTVSARSRRAVDEGLRVRQLRRAAAVL